MIPSALEDAAAIVGAETPDDLWRWLVLRPHLRAFRNTFEAVVAWQNLHRGHPADALRTAGLLCTDNRWRRVTTPLIAAIEDSGLLAGPELDELAEGFLHHERFRWPVPAAWVTDGTVSIDPQASPSDTPPYLERMVAPPLRRWAANRIARSHPHRSHELLGRTTELDARAGDAVLTGLLDAAVAYPEDARDALIDLGLSWPGGAVRLRALQLLATRDGPQAGALRAAPDPSGKIRQWGASLLRAPGIHEPAGPADGPTTSAATPPEGRGVEQASLFG